MNPAEQYMVSRPEPYKTIVLHLQAIIESTIPDLALRFKYGIPFYYYQNRPFCYINVSLKKSFVDLGMVKGQQIAIHADHHIRENRKKMISLRYFELDDIDEEILIDVLEEAKSLY